MVMGFNDSFRVSAILVLTKIKDPSNMGTGIYHSSDGGYSPVNPPSAFNDGIEKF